jgi:acetylornithine deacetylase/succinyl-diaminopimelate desuccinylase-like protein
MTKITRRFALATSTAILFSSLCQAQAPGGKPTLDPANRQLARDIFEQLININTTDSVGNVTTASDAMRQRLLDAGFPAADLQVLGPNDRKKNLVVRFHGRPGATLKPVLVIGHVDVVEAQRADWTLDPFTFTEKDGFFYGRGTQDMKCGDAAMITTLIRLKREGFVPDRDIIFAMTADEEGGKSNGVDWLLTHQRDLAGAASEIKDAAFVINLDAGGLETVDSKPVVLMVEATEKTYADFRVTATNPGGHSSLPRPDNAIYQLAAALLRLEHSPFPFELNPVTRAELESYAGLLDKGESRQAEDMRAILKTPPDPAAIGRLSANPEYNSILRTTCVATMLSGGHAPNALPGRAQANVNCRILPGHSGEEVRQDLIKIFADPALTVEYVSDAGEVSAKAPERESAPPPPLNPQVMDPLRATVQIMWPGLKILPEMEAGASDSIYTMAAGLPSYGISGMGIDRGGVRAHGRDERIGIESYFTGVEFEYLYFKAMTAK